MLSFDLFYNTWINREGTEIKFQCPIGSRIGAHIVFFSFSFSEEENNHPCICLELFGEITENCLTYLDTIVLKYYI